MRYIFVVNGRRDKSHIMPDLQKQIEEVTIDHIIYETKGVGDGTRYVRLYCEFHDKEEICFVACGGSGTTNEVAAGIIGFENKYMAILSYGTSNDFIKYYPDRTFNSLKGIIEGEKVKIDAIKCNSDYAINVVNIGFDGRVAYDANRNIEAGIKDGYNKALRAALFGYRYNKLEVIVDGEKISKWRTLLCVVANAKYCGGQFLCAPRAKVDDGLMDICLIPSCTLLTFLRVLPYYTEGKHLDNEYCKSKIVYRQARHVEVNSKDLIYVSLDGEIIAATHFELDILDKAVSLILPRKETGMKKLFDPIKDKAGTIIEYLMSSPDIPSDESLRFKIRLSIEEAVENVVRYAYNDGIGWMEVGTELDKDRVILTIRIKDAGKPFNPLEQADPDVTASAEDRDIGGLGIYLCKQMMDTIEYRYEDGCNILTMTKKVS